MLERQWWNKKFYENFHQKKKLIVPADPQDQVLSKIIKNLNYKKLQL